MILKICAFAVIASITAVLLREFGWRGVPLFAVISFIGIISVAEQYLSSVKEVFLSFSDDFGISKTVSAVLKIIGVGYLGGICADVCTELGSNAVASGVSLVTRLEIIAICAPFFIDIVRLGTELIG